MATNLPIQTAGTAAFDWQNMDFSWLNPNGEGFGGGDPLTLYRSGTFDFSWLPPELLPKIPDADLPLGRGGWTYVPATDGGTEGGGNPTLPGTQLVWRESFDHGLGMLSHSWGNVDTSVPGQVTLTSYAADGYLKDSGVMVPPTGATAGNGYGLYSFTLSFSNGSTGPFALLWPATDRWPGPELDLVEQKDGMPYSTIHWKGGDGDDAFSAYLTHGIDTTQIHTYAMNWQRDFIDLYIDGNLKQHITEHVPFDAADGARIPRLASGCRPTGRSLTSMATTGSRRMTWVIR